MRRQRAVEQHRLSPAGGLREELRYCLNDVVIDLQQEAVFDHFVEKMIDIRSNDQVLWLARPSISHIFVGRVLAEVHNLGVHVKVLA